MKESMRIKPGYKKGRLISSHLLQEGCYYKKTIEINTHYSSICDLNQSENCVL